MDTNSTRSTTSALAGLLLLIGAGCSDGANEPSATVQSTLTSAPAAAPSDSSQASEVASSGAPAGLATLDTGYDLSTLNAANAAGDGSTSGLVNPLTAGDADGHEGHNHDADDSLLAESGGLQSTAIRYLGGISMAEGVEKTHNFGKIREGDSDEYAFDLISDGKEGLVIQGVKPSCGCTKAVIEVFDDAGELTKYEKGDLIPTGTRFRLVTAVSSEGKKGEFSATVSIYTNAPGGAFNLRLTAEAEPVLDVEPEQNLYFGQMTTADQAERTVRVTSHRGELFLLSVRTKNLPATVQVDVTAVDPDEDGRSNTWDARVTVGPGLAIGVRNYPCVLMSDMVMPSPKYPKADGSPTYYSAPLAVQARVTGMVHAEPAFVGFGMIRPSELVERAIHIECYDDFVLTADIPVRFEGLYGGEFEYADLFKATIEPAEDGHSAELKLELTGMPDDLNGSFGGIMRIGVGHPTMEELTVRFSGVCRVGLKAKTGN